MGLARDEEASLTRQEALDFVEKHGVVLQAARGPAPSLAEFVAGERIQLAVLKRDEAWTR
jgi:hypothetical protein